MLEFNEIYLPVKNPFLVYFEGHKSHVQRGFIVGSLLVSFLGIKATLKKEFMATSFPRSCYNNHIREALSRLLSISVKSQISSA